MGLGQQRSPNLASEVSFRIFSYCGESRARGRWGEHQVPYSPVTHSLPTLTLVTLTLALTLLLLNIYIVTTSAGCKHS